MNPLWPCRGQTFPRRIPRPLNRYSYRNPASGSQHGHFAAKSAKNGIFTRNFLISHTFRQLSATLLYFSLTFPQFYDTSQIGYTPNDFHAHAHSPKLSTIDGISIVSLSKIELFFFLKLTSLGAKSPFFYIFSSSTPSSNLRWSSYDGRKTIYHFQRQNLSFGSFTSQTLIIQSDISI